METGELDLASANANANTVSVLLGQAGGVFGGPTDFGVGTVPYSVAPGDFNGDGKLDLAVANVGSITASVLLNQTPDGGTLSFSAATNYGVGSVPRAIAVGDLNGDGKLDLVSANVNVSTVSVLLGQGGGAFSPAADVGVGSAAYSVAVADLNGDGSLDLAEPSSDSSLVSVALNQGLPPSAWTGLGFGLAGVTGLPSLSGAGTLAAGSADSFTLGNANTSAAVLLFTALSSTPVPFKGGTLAAFPDLVDVEPRDRFLGRLVSPVHVAIGRSVGDLILVPVRGAGCRGSARGLAEQRAEGRDAVDVVRVGHARRRRGHRSGARTAV